MRESIIRKTSNLLIELTSLPYDVCEIIVRMVYPPILLEWGNFKSPESNLIPGWDSCAWIDSNVLRNIAQSEALPDAEAVWSVENLKFRYLSEDFPDVYHHDKYVSKTYQNATDLLTCKFIHELSEESIGVDDFFNQGTPLRVAYNLAGINMDVLLLFEEHTSHLMFGILKNRETLLNNILQSEMKRGQLESDLAGIPYKDCLELIMEPNRKNHSYSLPRKGYNYSLRKPLKRYNEE